jgi:abhydrolase domain-containing protein 6
MGYLNYQITGAEGKMKKKLAVVMAVVVVLAVGLYFVLPGLLVGWARDKERKAAGLTEKSLRIAEHEIAYLEGGQGTPILMVHGFAANKDNWTRFCKFITPSYHAVALDLPGFGNSTYVENASYGITDQAKRLDEFVNAAGLKKFHIVGNSMGGYISARYSIMFPEKVMTLGLFDASGVKPPIPSEMAIRLSKGEPNPLIAKSADEFDQMLKFVFVKPPEIPWIIRNHLVKEAMSHNASNSRISKQTSGEFGLLEQDLGKIKARTLVLWGANDRVTDVSAVQVFEKGLPNCATVIMKDCGHLPMIERPQEAAEHYLEFLKGR